MARSVIITSPEDLDDVAFAFAPEGFVTPHPAAPLTQVTLTLTQGGVVVGAAQIVNANADGSWAGAFDVGEDEGEYVLKAHQTLHPNIYHTVSFNVPANPPGFLKKPKPGKKKKK